jgi:hypothetical protein
MGTLRRREQATGTSFHASCWTGWASCIMALIIMAVGGVLAGVATSFLWPALTQLFGPSKGGAGGWMAWLFDQFMSVALLPVGLIGLALVVVGLVLLAMGLVHTSVRRDGDDLVSDFGLLGLRVAQRRIPLSSIARLRMRIADRTSVGEKEYVNLDLVAHFRPDIAIPSPRGFGLLGWLVLRINELDRRPVTCAALLCKLPDDETTRRQIDDVARSWNLDFDPTHEARPSMSAIREERQRADRQRLGR